MEKFGLSCTTFGRQQESVSRNSPQWGFGAGKSFGEQPTDLGRQPTGLTKRRLRRGEKDPGVGAHEPSALFGKQVLSTQRTNKGFVYNESVLDEKRRRLLDAAKERCKEGPGPGAYSLDADDKVRHRGTGRRFFNSLPVESKNIEASHKRNPGPPAPGTHDVGRVKLKLPGAPKFGAGAAESEITNSTIGRVKTFPAKGTPACSFGQGFGAEKPSVPKEKIYLPRKFKADPAKLEEVPSAAGRNALGKQVLSVHAGAPAYTMRGPGGENPSKQLEAKLEKVAEKEEPSAAHYDQTAMATSFGKLLKSNTSTAPAWTFGDGKIGDTDPSQYHIKKEDEKVDKKGH